MFVLSFIVSKFCLTKEKLIRKLVPERGAFNSLRQGGLHTSFVLSVELGASLRGGGWRGLGGLVWHWFCPDKALVQRNYEVTIVLEQKYYEYVFLTQDRYLGCSFFFTWRQILSGLNFNKFSLSFNWEVFRMIRASLEYSGSGIQVISWDICLIWREHTCKV